MIDVAREAARVRPPLLAISAVAWGVLAASPGVHGRGMAICSAAGGLSSSAAAPLRGVHAPAALMAGWGVMLVAMMAPLIIAQIHHVRFTSLARRRARSIALFVVGYGAVWMAVGAVLAVAATLALAAAPGSYAPMVAVGLGAGLWQASPFKQRCLNGCHTNPPLRVFGHAADRDAFRFGLTHGLWCAGSCGALMCLPLTVPGAHLPAMAAVAILLFCERLDDPAPPGWKVRGLGKASRMLLARLRVRWRLSREGLGLQRG